MWAWSFDVSCYEAAAQAQLPASCRGIATDLGPVVAPVAEATYHRERTGGVSCSNISPSDDFVHWPWSSRETCQLSLNGTEALDESMTLAELGIVSGDLLHVLSQDHDDPSSAQDAGQSPQQHVCETDVNMKSSSHEVELENRVSPDFTHFQDFCRSLSSAKEKKTLLCVELNETAALCSALHSLMLDSGFTLTEVSLSAVSLYLNHVPLLV